MHEVNIIFVDFNDRNIIYIDKKKKTLKLIGQNLGLLYHSSSSSCVWSMIIGSSHTHLGADASRRYTGDDGGG
jgi:hypothetical protein